MKHKKVLICILVLFLSTSVLLPTVAARMTPSAVGFSANTSGPVLVLVNPSAIGISDFSIVTIGNGRFNIAGSSYLPPGITGPTVQVQGVMLKSNCLSIAFDNKAFDVRFSANALTDGLFIDEMPLSDSFWLGFSNFNLLFSGIYRDGTKTYNIMGTASVLTWLAIFSEDQVEPVPIIAIALVAPDGELIAEFCWALESVNLQIGSTIFLNLPAATIFNHSLDFVMR